MQVFQQMAERLTSRIAAFITELEILDSAGPPNLDFHAQLESAACTETVQNAGQSALCHAPQCVDIGDIRHAVQWMLVRVLELCFADPSSLQELNIRRHLVATFQGSIAGQLVPISSQFNAELFEEQTDAAADAILSECLHELQANDSIVVESDELRLQDTLCNAALTIFEPRSVDRSTGRAIHLLTPLPRRNRGLDLDDTSSVDRNLVSAKMS